MKKIISVSFFILLALALCGCSGKKTDISPVTRGISFTAELTYYNECYLAEVKIAESGEEPDPAKYVKRAEDGKVEFNTQFQKESGNKEVYEIK